MKCCNKEILLQKATSKTKGDYVYYKCDSCGKSGAGGDEKQALETFNNSNPSPSKTIGNSLVLATVPKDKNSMTEWVNSNMLALIKKSANFQDKPATIKMIEKNTDYLVNSKHLIDLWQTDDGIASLIKSFEEANYNAAIMPEMGSIVPFGDAKFVPSIEGVKFSMTVGKNAPFREIDIVAICENDTHDNYQEDGNFIFTIKRGLPRGEIIGVMVSGIRTDVNKKIGDIYDIEFLTQKAKDHSKPYKKYLEEKEDFTRMKLAGELKVDDFGRKFYVKTIEYTKNGQKKSFNKNIYEKDITNIHETSDKIKMFTKSAGKSFFNEYLKTRNATEMADEWNDDDVDTVESFENTADTVLNNAMGQFESEGHPLKDTQNAIFKYDGKQSEPRYKHIKDAEIIKDEKNIKGEKKDLNKNQEESQNEKDELSEL